ncbi:MAG TPA: TIGR03915 family putative DNA repair protein [Methylophilus sp.]
MQIVRLADAIDFEGWRNAARALLAQGIAPEHIEWYVGEGHGGLFDQLECEPQAIASLQVSPNQHPSSQHSVSRDFIELCRQVILHNDPTRFSLLYRLLWRLKQAPGLLQLACDSDVARAHSMVKAVRRDLHKMKAFVRFREIEMPGGESEYVAWFEPTHHIVQASAAFFIGRFTKMHWSILTPEVCMHWDGQALRYRPGASKHDAPAEDASEVLWCAYYRSIFNPARLKVSAMQAQMPKKYWRNLPEAPLIAELIASAAQRADHMIETQPKEPRRKIVKYVADKVSSESVASQEMHQLHALNHRMLASTMFPLAVQATQAVLGKGAAPAAIMLLGAQPNEQEDLAGQPLTDAAGKLLDQALQAAGIARAEVYVTHVLKHYKCQLKGTRRVHMEPDLAEIEAYLPWLQQEMAMVQPQVIVAFGEVAAWAITGKQLDMESSHGKLLALIEGQQLILSCPPAYVLHTLDQATQELRYQRLVTDLRLAAQAVNRSCPSR